MAVVDVIVATGGMGIVKAAYSSGKPAYGVGPGNVPCIFDKDIDINDAVVKVIEGRVFNNGLPCACEQAVIVSRKDVENVIAVFQKHKSAYIDNKDDIRKLEDLLFIDGVLNRDCVGISANAVAQKAGISIPEDSVIILANGNLTEGHGLLRKEKLSPVLLLFTYETFEEAIRIAKANLELEGKGHSASIHSNDRDHIELFAHSVDVSRIVVNQTCTTSAGGSYLNSFTPTTTLGCGTWGNNIISENLTYKHLMNVTRIGYSPQNPKIPSQQEIWSLI